MKPERTAYDALEQIFADEGSQDYLGEAVTMDQHMLQTAYAARQAGATQSLVVAAAVHDVGHFEGAVSGRDLMKGTDNHHDDVAASWLSQWFGEEVTEPVRLHVDAKRYLCAVEPSYYDQLSDASKYTMEVQGGPMNPAEVAAFEMNPHHRDAVQLRRFDDMGKDPDLDELRLADFRADIEALDHSPDGHSHPA